METTLEKQLTPAQEIERSLEENGITITLINGMKKYADLKVTAEISQDGHLIVDKDELKEVNEARKKIKNTRVLIEKVCKKQRDRWTTLKNENLKKENEYLSTLTPIETKLLAEEKKPEILQKQIDDENERKQEEVFQSRVQQLIAFEVKFDGHNYFDVLNKVSAVDLKFMSEENFRVTIDNFKIAFENEKIRLDEIESERKAIEEKLAEQKAEQEKERIRLENIAKEQEAKQAELKAEQEKIDAEKTRIENERLAKIKKRRSEELRPYIVFIRDYNTMIILNEEEYQKELSEVKKGAELQWEADRKETQRQADEKIKNELKQKEQYERAAKEKEEKRLKRMPDKKLLQDFADNIMFNIAPPAEEYLKSDEAKEIVKKAKVMFKEIEVFVKSEIDKL